MMRGRRFFIFIVSITTHSSYGPYSSGERSFNGVR